MQDIFVCMKTRRSVRRYKPDAVPQELLAPIVEELANEANGAYKVGKVNVDEAPELAARYRIAGIPAIVVFKDGEVYKKSIGVVPKADLEELLK